MSQINSRKMSLFADEFIKMSSFISTPFPCKFSTKKHLADEMEVHKSHDIRHLIGQIFGTQKVFGYSSTVLNRLHLMYYFLGEFYVSSIFSKRIRWFWILFNIINGTLLLIQCFSCLILSWSSQTTAQVLYNVQIITTVSYYLIVTPLITCVNRNHTTDAFKILDRIIDSQCHQIQSINSSCTLRKEKYHAVGVISTIIFVQILLMSFYCSSTEMRIVLGYSKDDLKNSNNYLYPVYCDYVDTLGEYLVLVFSQITFSLPTLGSPFLIPLFVILSVDRFYDQFDAISHTLNCNSKNFAKRYELLVLDNKSFDKKQIKRQRCKLVDEFTQDIQSYARLHHDLLRGIRHLKFYLQSSISISLAMFLFVEVILFYIFILFEDESLVLRIKILTFAFGLFNILFVNCAAGNLLADMGDMFKNAVYNVPWYYLPPWSRKSVYLLLYQAQVTVGFKSLKIYSLNMELFDRFCRYVYSAVSVLRGYHKDH